MSHLILPKEASSDTTKFLRGDGTWATPAGGATKEFFVPFLMRGDLGTMEAYQTAKGYYALTNQASAKNVNCLFKVPADFTSLTSCKLAMIPTTTDTIQFDIYVAFNAHGEAYNGTANSALNKTASVTADQIYEYDINVDSIFSGIAAGDLVGVLIDSDYSNIRLLGLTFKYA